MSDHEPERRGDGWEGSIGGNCPVQGEGKVDGFSWYFRSRWSTWSFSVSLLLNGDPVSVAFVDGDPGFSIEREFCESPDAGWIEEAQAWVFIETAIGEFRTWLQTQTDEDLAKLSLASALHVQELQRKARERS